MKRSNLLLALLCLFLGAALADWLSARDANAQALPPSSGGSSYTHPSAISLSNGIFSGDGGTFYGRPVFHSDGGHDAIEISGGAANGSVIKIPGDTKITSGLYTFGVVFSEFQSNASAHFPSVRISNTTGTGIDNSGGSYSRVTKYGAGAPTGTDCDAAGEAGRTYYDTTNHFQYFCEGAAGWYKSGVYAP